MDNSQLYLLDQFNCRLVSSVNLLLLPFYMYAKTQSTTLEIQFLFIQENYPIVNFFSLGVYFSTSDSFKG